MFAFEKKMHYKQIKTKSKKKGKARKNVKRPEKFAGCGFFDKSFNLKM